MTFHIETCMQVNTGTAARPAGLLFCPLVSIAPPTPANPSSMPVPRVIESGCTGPQSWGREGDDRLRSGNALHSEEFQSGAARPPGTARRAACDEVRHLHVGGHTCPCPAPQTLACPPPIPDGSPVIVFYISILPGDSRTHSIPPKLKDPTIACNCALGTEPREGSSLRWRARDGGSPVQAPVAVRLLL